MTAVGSLLGGATYGESCAFLSCSHHTQQSMRPVSQVTLEYLLGLVPAYLRPGPLTHTLKPWLCHGVGQSMAPCIRTAAKVLNLIAHTIGCISIGIHLPARLPRILPQLQDPIVQTMSCSQAATSSRNHVGDKVYCIINYLGWWLAQHIHRSVT